MTTTPVELHGLQQGRHLSGGAIGALILAIGGSFLAGRATVRAPPPVPAARPAAAAPAVAPEAPPPWATHGFRDDEHAWEGCLAGCDG